MMNMERMIEELEKTLSKERFVHSLNVMEEAVKIASHYGADREKARVAGLLHDCGKIAAGEAMVGICESYHAIPDEMSRQEPGLLHAPLGVVLAKRVYGIEDEGILAAIRTHTTGCRDMSLLQKIVFIADYIEPGREFKGVDDIRKEVFRDLDAAIIMALDYTIKHVIDRGMLLHPDTVEARNFLLAERKPGNQGK